MNLLAGFIDVENNLVYYLNRDDIRSYLVLSKANYNFMTTNRIYNLMLAHNLALTKAKQYNPADVNLNNLIIYLDDNKIISENLLEWASANGHVELFDWWIRTNNSISKIFKNQITEHDSVTDSDSDENINYKNCYPRYSIDIASENGHTNILEWWLANAISKPAEQDQWLANAISKPAEQDQWLANAISKPAEQDQLLVNAIDKPAEQGSGRWKQSDLVINYTDEAVDKASENGHINILNWWIKSGLDIKYTNRAINNVCDTDNLAVLNWWLNSGLELKYSSYAITLASQSGHLKVIEWLLFKLKIIIKDLEKVIQFVSSAGHVHILDWCKLNANKLNLKFIYTDSVMDMASYYGHTNILGWWFYSGFEIKYSENAIDNVSKNRVNVLDWWFNHSNIRDPNSSLEFKYTVQSTTRASEYNYIDVLDWWKNHDDILEFKYDSIAIDLASEQGCIEALNWWLASGYKLKYRYWSIDKASQYGCIDVLNWWLASGLKLKYSENAMDCFFVNYYFNSDNSDIIVLQWWIDSGLPLKYSKEKLLEAIKTNNILRDWYEKSGLANIS